MANDEADLGAEPDRFASGWIRERLDQLLAGVDDTGFALEVIDIADEASALLDDWMEALVVIARDYDFSWEDISANLRITRQAAWSRWRDLAPDRTRDPAVIELLVGIGAERRLKRRTTEHDVQEWVGAAGGSEGDHDAIVRFVERRARERRASRTQT